MSHLADYGRAAQHISSSISRPAVALVIDATYRLNLGHHHITARIRFYPHGHMSTITELEAALRGAAADADAYDDGDGFFMTHLLFDAGGPQEQVGGGISSCGGEVRQLQKCCPLTS